jgi:flagellar biosynthesis/type III secretory pathway protein FliH
MTWGTSVGGMVMPLDNYLRTGNFDLTDDQRYLVLAGIAFIMFYENKRGLSKILEKIKEDGLEDAFKSGLEKAKDLKESFKSFLSSINVTVGSFLDTVAYSFLIPIILDIQSVASKSTDLKEASMLITERLIASGVVIVSAKVLASVIKKILERLK